MKLFLPLMLMMLTVQEQGFTVWSQDVEQHRPVMHIDQRLVDAANYKAQLLAETGIIAHCINGYCPNQMIRDFGCKTEYEDANNQVESIAIGFRTVGDAYKGLRESPSHSVHMLGLDTFESQDEIGVGYYFYNNTNYYIFISANCLE